jgi:ectoine hydroxylase-related dioxygenase (phytanoyl-CoA dioxygenase family)
VTRLSPIDLDVAAFRRDGHTVVRGLGTADDVVAVTQVLDPLLRRAAEHPATNTYDAAFVQLFNLWQRFEAVRRFTLSGRFAGAAADLMGVPAVRIYHDQALVKTGAADGRSGHTPWHQDQAYWPLDGARTVTMWMALGDCSPTMGTMQFVSGSHRCSDGTANDLRRLFDGAPISDASQSQLQRWIELSGHALSSQVTMTAGDASFHDGWVVHGAPANHTNLDRRAMTVIYVEDGAHVSTPDSDERRHDLATWLPGCQPGDLVDSPLNPRLPANEV